MRYVVFLLALALPGCASLGLSSIGDEGLSVPTTLSETGQEAAKLINNTKVALITAKNTVAQQLSDGMLTKQEAIDYRSKIDETWQKVKDSQKLLAGGQDALAKQKAQLLETGLAELQRQLVARIKKSKETK